MSKHKRNDKTMKYAESCDSRECKKKYKADIVKEFVETITTPHEINFTKKETTCLYCGKIRKL